MSHEEKIARVLCLVGEKFCVFCETPMEFRLAKLGANPPTIPPHVDVYLKCPNCGWVAEFGIPLSSDEYRELRDFINARVLEPFDRQESEEKIIEKLRKLGYYP